MRTQPRGPDAGGRARVDEMSDLDRDSLHILPLSIIPLKTSGLTRARLIKNVHLDTVVEVFEDAATGSGQIEMGDVPTAFGWTDTPAHPDLLVLHKLALLPSFDMYSLRILLRDQGIAINDHSALRLSKSKSAELTTYMTRFTRPLINHVYGRDDVEIQNFENLLDLFRDPDVKRALAKLKIMAARLDVAVDQVPKFLEDYGDIFLSLSYYRQALDSIEPVVVDFQASISQLREHWQLRRDMSLMKTCAVLHQVATALVSRLKQRFDSFDQSTADLWTNISAQRFRRIQREIASSHTAIGSILCGLTVKMEAWAQAFPNLDAGGPKKRADFILTQMRPAFDRIQELETMAGMPAGACCATRRPPSKSQSAAALVQQWTEKARGRRT